MGEFPLPVICRVLRVTQAGYHAWLKRPASLMAVKRDALTDLIRRVFAAFKGKYGAPRLYRKLCRQNGYTGSRGLATSARARPDAGTGAQSQSGAQIQGHDRHKSRAADYAKPAGAGFHADPRQCPQ